MAVANSHAKIQGFMSFEKSANSLNNLHVENVF